MNKKCSCCGAEYPLNKDNFGRRHNAQDGFVGVCRPCVRKRRNARNANNRDEVNRAQRVWRANLPGERAEKARQKTRNWYWANADRAKKYARDRLDRIRAEMLIEYGGKCACCGEDNPIFLTIDHVDGDGKAHRMTLSNCGTAVMVDLYKRGWPKEGFRLLCFNCNCGRQRNGGVCPHEIGRIACIEVVSGVAA